jgi:FtsP/CotA-like multicopper oxidase with cupredoxin domain
MVMMMNGFDTNFDGGNEIYAVNTVAFHYMRHPIQVKLDELVRIYVVNITEFDPINSFHTHATFFDEYRTGTKLEPDNFTDTIALAQGERSIIEFRYKFPGDYMFHAHVSEFAELGWAGMFQVRA